jgi:hypothetical protein
LADRGFDNKDSVGLYCSTLSIPAFTKGKKQLTGIEVEQTRQIANVRIHVERVIGVIHQSIHFYQPLSLMLQLSKIVPYWTKLYVLAVL